MSKVVNVAVAIIKKKNGEFLLTSRPEGKPWAGWWEFPGGKIESGELPHEALLRELQEELSIWPTQYQAWQEKRFDYSETHDSPAKSVHLHFFFVTDWDGDIAPNEGQMMCWQVADDVTVSPILPANISIMDDLKTLAEC